MLPRRIPSSPLCSAVPPPAPALACHELHQHHQHIADDERQLEVGDGLQQADGLHHQGVILVLHQVGLGQLVPVRRWGRRVRGGLEEAWQVRSEPQQGTTRHGFGMTCRPGTGTSRQRYARAGIYKHEHVLRQHPLGVQDGGSVAHQQRRLEQVVDGESHYCSSFSMYLSLSVCVCTVVSSPGTSCGAAQVQCTARGDGCREIATSKSV